MAKMMRIVSAVSLLAIMLGAASCSPMQGSSRGTDLLATGLVGWQQIGGQEGAWQYEPAASLEPGEGVLVTEGAGGGWLATLRQYNNFALSLEFRVPPGGNSGIFLRAPLEGNPAYEGMEIQILDDHAERWQDLEPYQYTGSIYGVQAPSERVTRPAGQWQEMLIIARGSKIQIGLNGRKIIDADLTNYPHKFESHPGLVRDEGYIGLQNHGSRVEFRNVRIRELPGA